MKYIQSGILVGWGNGV